VRKDAEQSRREAAALTTDRYFQALCRSGARFGGMFGFFSSRLGCLGSLLVSAIGTIILIVLMRGCAH
jgi:hypothetical protein